MPEPFVDALRSSCVEPLERRSSRLFGALLQLLLERSELGERRIGIRLLVAAAGAPAERLGVILLALGTIDRAPRGHGGRPRSAVRRARLRRVCALPLRPLLPLVPILALLLRSLLAVRIGRVGRCGRRGPRAGRGGIGRRPVSAAPSAGALVAAGGGAGRPHLASLRTLLTARPMRTALGAPGRPPNLDESRLLGCAVAADCGAALACGNCVGCNVSGDCLRLCGVFDKRDAEVHARLVPSPA